MHDVDLLGFRQTLLSSGASGRSIASLEGLSLGPIETWPQPLKTLVDVVLHTVGPAFVVWGPRRGRHE